MFQRLLIVIAQAKAGNISENLLNKIYLIILYIKQKRLLKKYITI